MDHAMTSNMAGMTGMDMATGTATASAAAATASSMSMEDMGMGGGSCKISMLWNWYTIDACFLAESWRITSRGMFAGSCIGVILLVMVLEGLRRAAKEYDAFLVRSRTKALPAPVASQRQGPESDSNPKDNAALPLRQMSFRPSLIEQTLRSLLHMLQFAVAYIIMLLAMYFNGYIIICIFIGAFLGAFVFNWQTIGLGGDDREITYCCG